MDAPEDTRSRIKAAALALCVSKGASETTVRDLARAAGIAEGTLYRHYPSKEALIAELFRENYTEFGRRMERVALSEPTASARLCAIVRQEFALFDREPTLYRFLLLMQSEALPRIPAEVFGPVHVARAILASGIEAGEIGLRDVDLGASIFLGFLVQPALSVVHGGLEAPLSRHADAVCAALTRALAS